MELALIIAAALIGFGVFFFLVKRVLRMAVRLALIGALLFALLAGAVAWWWYDPLGGAPSNRNARPPAARPARPR
jgi:multisubunit Na+/H+ antiporter MnhC subunit